MKEEIKDEDDGINISDDEDLIKNLKEDDDLEDLLKEETKEESSSDIFVPPNKGIDHLAQ